MLKRKTNSGFSFIELMVTFVIVGALAAIAYPAYMNQVMRGNRSDAQAALMDISQRLQRCFTIYNSYNDTTNCDVRSDLGTAGSATAGIVSPEGFYRISLANVTATSYTLQAVAIRAPQTNDGDCRGSTTVNTMTLTNTGAQAPADCW